MVDVAWMLAGASLLIYLFATNLDYLRRQLRIAWLMLRLPGPPAYPLIGNALSIVDHKYLYEQSCELTQLYRPVMRAWLGVFPVVFVADPKHIQKILGSSKHVEKIFLYRMLHSFLGEGLVTSEAAKWRLHRKLLQPSFHSNILESFISAFNNGAIECVKLLEAAAPAGTPFNAVSVVNNTVIHILYESILGIKTSSTSASTSTFRQGEMNFLDRCYKPWLLFNSVYKMTELAEKDREQRQKLAVVMKKRLKQRAQGLAEGDVKEICFIDHLLKIEDFTEKDCIEEATTFMLAGQDTVGSAVAFCLHELAKHPQVQDHVYEELQDIFHTSSRPATVTDLRDMKYLDQCVQETLRLYPSVPMIGRKLGEDVVIDDYVLPQGLNVIIPLFATHRIPEYYPEPARFIPERFEPQQKEARHPYAYLPFSHGSRNCIGYKYAMLEIKTIVSTILRRYRLLPVEGKESIQLRYRVTLRCSGGVWLRCEPRGTLLGDESIGERHL